MHTPHTHRGENNNLHLKPERGRHACTRSDIEGEREREERRERVTALILAIQLRAAVYIPIT